MILLLKRNSLFGQFSLIGSVALALLFSSQCAHAEDSSAMKNALGKAQFMLRQASNEKAELEKQLVAQKATIDSLEKQIAQLKKETSNKQSESSNQLNVINQLKDNGQKLQEKMQEKLSADAEKYRQLTSENEKLEEKLERQSNNFSVCYDNNKKLYDINQEILGKYKDKGFFAVLSQKEPLTSIGAVKAENLIQDYQYKMDGLTVKLIADDKAHSPVN